MIHVSICFDKDELFKSVAIIGHGDNLVCAGVSSCFIGSINALNDINNFIYQVKEGDSFIKAIKKVNEHDKVVLETLFVQLITISSKYPKDVKISRERI